MTWATLTTPQRIHLITTIWREGMTSEEISKAVGATKNSIIGMYKRHRDKLSETPLPKRGKHGNHYRKKPKPVGACVPLRVSLVDNNGCSWPVTDGSPYLFCGHVKLGRYSYCAWHHKLSRGPGTYSERSAHRVSDRHASS